MQALIDAIGQAPVLQDACRVFHGRGGMHPGCEHLALDWLAPVWLLTSFKPLSDAELTQCHAALKHRWSQCAPDQPLNWVYQCRHEGQAETRLMTGDVPEPHVVSEQGALYRVHLLKGQNHGLFLDMAEGRAWIKAHAQDQKVLNLFAYTCAFSVVALQGGAKHVVNVDMSHGAMTIGQQNHRLNGLDAGASFLAHDIFKTWGKIGRMGPYGLIVVDPPSYQKGSFVATKDYIKLIRRLPDLLRPGGHVLLCLNAPELDCNFLQHQVAQAAPDMQFIERLPNPASFADINPEKALKVLHYQYS